MMLKIFELLSNKDLCNVCLVSLLWRCIGSDPSLWRRFNVETVIDDIKKPNEILKSSRLSKLFLNFNFEVDESYINTKTILQSNIRKLNMKWVDMRFVMKDSILLLDKLESLTITNCRLKQEQAEEIFEKLQEVTTLKQFCLINPIIIWHGEVVGLSKVSKENLLRGLSKIKHVNLHKVNLTFEQEEILKLNMAMKGQAQTLEITGQSNITEEVKAMDFLKNESLQNLQI